MVPTSLPTQSSMSSQKSYDLIGSTAPDPSKISGGPSQLASELAWVLYASRVVKNLDLCMLLVHVICIVNLQTCIHIGLFEAAITAFDDLWDTKLIWTNMNKIEFVNGLVGYYSSSILSPFVPFGAVPFGKSPGLRLKSLSKICRVPTSFTKHREQRLRDEILQHKPRWIIFTWCEMWFHMVPCSFVFISYEPPKKTALVHWQVECA